MDVADWGSFLELVEVNFKEQRRVSFYADQLNMTTKKLETLCKLNGGMTVFNCIMSRVLKEAEFLLLYSEMELKEIGYELGFSQQAHLNNFFKQQRRITPGDFRKGNS